MKPPADGARSFLVSWAHLAVLWSFAFAQPLFDILSDSPEFFVARENTGGDIVVLALGVTLVPPTLLLWSSSCSCVCRACARPCTWPSSGSS